MKHIAATLLLLSVLAAPAAISTANGPFVVNPTTTRYITPGTPMSVITNRVATASVGTLIYFQGPARYHITTNTTTWSVPGINFYFEPGVTVVFGCDGDTTASGSRPIWANLSAGTNSVAGYGSFVISNQNSVLIDMQASSSELFFECVESKRLVVTGTTPLVKQADSTRLRLFARGNLENWSYDVWWGTGNGDGLRTDLTVLGQIVAADSGIEFSGGYDDGYPGIFRVGSIVRRNTTADSAGLLSIGTNMRLDIGQIGGTGTGGGTNWFIALDHTQAGASKTTPSILRAGSIRCDASASDHPYLFEAIPVGNFVGKWRIVDTIIDSPTNRTAAVFQMYDSSISLENTEINFRNTGITNSITRFGDGTGTEFVDGRWLKCDKPTWNIPINFGPIIGVHTNSYAGTNVVVSLDGQTVQALVATNAMLLILTNTANLESGKEVCVTLYNNKATNMNVAYTGAGYRPMNQVQNTVTNGRSLVLNIKYVGTNYHVISSQQQN
jgi:hypothetical protein